MCRGDADLIKKGEKVYYMGWLLHVAALSKKKGPRAPYFRLESVRQLISHDECTPQWPNPHQ